MNAFETAREFFKACETPLGWQACSVFCAENATFDAQSAALADIKTLQGYCDWMHAFGTITAAGATYDLHSSAWDEANQTAVFFATYTATHVGEGGPVAPTGKTTSSHYVYSVKMNPSGKVCHVTKIWNDSWAARELGWA